MCICVDLVDHTLHNLDSISLYAFPFFSKISIDVNVVFFVVVVVSSVAYSLFEQNSYQAKPFSLPQLLRSVDTTSFFPSVCAQFQVECYFRSHYTD